MRWIWIVACVGVLGAPIAAGAIFRCAGAEGEVLFTDVACPTGRPQPTREINTVEWVGPDDADEMASAKQRATVPRLHTPDGRSHTERSRTPAAESKRVMQRSSGVASVDASDAAARRCDAARDRLDAVRATMRRGYKASSAARLEARLHDARERVERDCAR
jgi:hypothetical protein